MIFKNESLKYWNVNKMKCESKIPKLLSSMQNLIQDRQPNGCISLNILNNWVAKYGPSQRNLLASLSDSSRVRMSLFLTGPLTFLVICHLLSSINYTLTWVTYHFDHVLPIIFITVAYFTSEFILPLTAKNENM